MIRATDGPLRHCTDDHGRPLYRVQNGEHEGKIGDHDSLCLLVGLMRTRRNQAWIDEQIIEIPSLINISK